MSPVRKKRFKFGDCRLLLLALTVAMCLGANLTSDLSEQREGVYKDEQKAILPLCAPLPDIDEAKCTIGSEASRLMKVDDYSDDDKDSIDDDRREVALPSGTRCVFESADGASVVMECLEGAWVRTDEDGQNWMVKKREKKQQQFVVNLTGATTKGCVVLCPNDSPPSISCPNIDAQLVTDWRTNSTRVSWEQRPTATDREEGRLRTWRTSGVIPGSRLTNGSYHVSFMTKDSTGKADTCVRNFEVKVRRCPNSHTFLINGKAVCSSQTLYGSKCDYSCQPGYHLDGSATSYCQSDGSWNKPKPTCQEISCGPPKNDNQTGLTLTCGSHLHGSTCGVTCSRNGYSLQGANTISCMFKKAWTKPGLCLDTMPPVVRCNKTMTVYAGPNRTSVNVSWTSPPAEDNSGLAVNVTSNPLSGSVFDPGGHMVTFTGVDVAGNKAMCHITIAVQVKTCSAASSHPEFSNTTCSHENVYGSVCTIKCHQGYQLEGDATLICQENKTWSGKSPKCTRKVCPAPPTVSHGVYQCLNGHEYQESCSLTCDSGYTPVAPLTITCNASIQWSQSGSCLDTEPPVFPSGCPLNIIVPAARLGNITKVNYDLPQVTENSGERSNLECDHKPGSNFSLGDTYVSVKAKDSQGNRATCHFHVLVRNISCDAPLLDVKEKLLLYDCPNNYVHGASCQLSCPGGKDVEGASSISCERSQDGQTLTWVWKGRKTPKCPDQDCLKLTSPTNGALQCSNINRGMGSQCKVTCDESFMHPQSVPDMFTCFSTTGRWTNDGHVPPCIARRKAEQVLARPVLYFRSSACPANIKGLKTKFLNSLTSSVLQRACGSLPCSVKNVDISCHSMARETQLHVTLNIDLGLYQDKGSNKESLKFYEEVMESLNSNLLLDSEYGQFDVQGAGQFESYNDASIEYKCSPGTIFTSKTMSCAGCGEGFKYDNTTQFCSPCPQGTYQDKEVSSTCVPCPDKTSTKHSQATNVSQCLALCSPGTFSASGIQPCDPCPKGTHQSAFGMTSCDVCPFGMSTPSVSSKLASDCQFYNVRLSKESSGPVLNLTTTDPVNFTIAMWVHPVSSRHVKILTFGLTSGSDHVQHAHFGIGNGQIFVRSQLPKSGMSIRTWYHVALVYTNETARLFVDGQLQEESELWEKVSFGNKTLKFSGTDPLKSIIVSGVQMSETELTEEEVVELAASCNKYLDNNILVTEQADVTLVTPSACDDEDNCTGDPCGEHGTCVDGTDQFTCVCDEPWSGDTCQHVPDYCVGHKCANNATCVNLPEDGGYKCNCTAGFRGRLCQTRIVSGGWGEWGGWGACSVTCGTGQKLRVRECNNPIPDPGGANCPGNETEAQPCQGDVCPIDGRWSEWSAWLCTSACGEGIATRNRTCDNPMPNHGGVMCAGSSNEYKMCNGVCKVDGRFGPWSDWSQCSVTCGGGVSTRQRLCDSPAPSGGGLACDSEKAAESRVCHSQECPECPELVARDDQQTVSCFEDEVHAMKICDVTCNSGLVLFPNTVGEFQCGRSTNYTWSHQTHDNPMGKLPVCAAIRKPISQRIRLTIGYGDIRCSQAPLTSELENAIAGNLDKNISCRTSGECSRDVTVFATCKSKKRQATGTLTAAVVMEVDEGESQSGSATYKLVLEEMMMQLMRQSGQIFNVKVAGQELNGKIISAQLETICYEGSGLYRGDCVDCPEGSYSASNGSCLLCERGFFQNETRSTSCLECTEGLTTAGVGASSEDECEIDPPDYSDFFNWTYVEDYDYDYGGGDGLTNSTLDKLMEEDGESNSWLIAGVVGGATVLLAVLITVGIMSIIRSMKTDNVGTENPDMRYTNQAYLGTMFSSDYDKEAEYDYCEGDECLYEELDGDDKEQDGNKKF